MNRYLIQSLLLLALVGCSASSSVTNQSTSPPKAQPTPSLESISHIPDQFGESIGDFNIEYSKDDSLSYQGYQVLRGIKKIKALVPKGYIEAEYAILRRNGKVIATFDGTSSPLREVRFGLYSFLGAETKQLVIEQTAPKFWQYWIVSLSPKFEIIYDSGKYDVVYEMRTIDINSDGRYEIVQNLGTFWYFHHLGNVGSPRPPIIFKYDVSGKRYMPANREFQAMVLQDIEQRITKAHEINKSKDEPVDRRELASAVIDVMLRYLYAGKEQEAWAFFDKEYDIIDSEKPRNAADRSISFDKEIIKADLKEKLKGDVLYREITRRAQPNNSFNRSANSVAFIRETLLLLRFVAPG